MSIPPPPGPGSPQQPWERPGGQDDDPWAPPSDDGAHDGRRGQSGPGGGYGPHGQPPGAYGPGGAYGATGPFGPHGPQDPPGPYGPWGGGYGGPPVPPPVNGFAIAALVLGILCFVPLLGAVFGVLALFRIRRTGERGKAMAVWGIALSCLGVVLYGLALIGGGWGEFTKGFKEAAEEAARPTFSVSKGECFTTPSGGIDGITYDVDEVPCGDPHDGEAFGTYRVAGGAGAAFPGDQKLWDQADDRCQVLGSAYAMDSWTLPDDVDLYYFTPTRESWKLGDREVSCVFGHTDGETRLTGSLRNDAAMRDADQLAYLRADHHLLKGLNAAPDATYVEDDLPGHKKWAVAMSRELRAQRDALRAHDWKAGSAPAVNALIKDLDEARKAWDRAARARDADAYYLHYDRGMNLVDPSRAVPARKALDLGVRPPRELTGALGLDDAPGKPEKPGKSEESGKATGSGGSGAAV
ncbi:DUF4190 domain-containing protein [Streptomyces sp. JNUCC 64]